MDKYAKYGGFTGYVYILAMYYIWSCYDMIVNKCIVNLYRKLYCFIKYYKNSIIVDDANKLL